MALVELLGLPSYQFLQRCVSCHTISQTHTLCTDKRFHNINLGFQRISKDIAAFSGAFTKAKQQGTNVDIAVLSNTNTSELGRFEFLKTLTSSDYSKTAGVTP